MRMTWNEKVFVGMNYSILTLITLVIALPFWYVLVVSFTPYSDFVQRDGLVLFPTDVSFQYYAYLLKEGSTMYGAYSNTLRNTIGGVALALFLTATSAYALSDKRLPGRKWILLFFVLTMFFRGGMIPLYITIKQLGLLNTNVVLIIVMAFSAFLMIIMKTFFEALPESLRESAAIDGASETRIFAQIMLPLSLPVITSVGLMYMVTYWNDFFNAMLYVSDWSKAPVQLVLRTMIVNSTLPPEMMDAAGATPPPTVGIQMAGIVIVALPMMILYPFLQKYFQQGMMVGSIKG